MENVTKKYKKNRDIFRLLSLILTILPLLVYIIMAFINGKPSQKVTMGICCFTSLIFVMINIVFKYHIRSTIWVCLIGIYCCISNIVPLLIIMAITTILDEFIFTPLSKKYNSQYKINKEIDKRAPESEIQPVGDKK